MQLPRFAGAKIIPLADVTSPSAHAISNLTRKAARAALSSVEPSAPTALAARA
jgi:hypothetical protein